MKHVNGESFGFIVPLKDIFGFCDDYTKVIYGLKHTLTLVRRNDNDAIIRNDAAGAGKITNFYTPFEKIDKKFLPSFNASY